MTLIQEFADVLAGVDALRAILVAAGIPRHAAEALNDHAARLDAFALKVAAQGTEPKKTK